MKKTTIFLMAALLAIGLGTLAYGTTSSTLSVSDSHNVSVTVSEEHKVSLATHTSPAASLSVAPSDGSAATQPLVGELTYATNDYTSGSSYTSLKLTVGKGATTLPTTLSVYTASVRIGTSSATTEGGAIPITGTASDLITGISNDGEESGVDITYVAVVPGWSTSATSATATVTYELVGV